MDIKRLDAPVAENVADMPIGAGPQRILKRRGRIEPIEFDIRTTPGAAWAWLYYGLSSVNASPGPNEVRMDDLVAVANYKTKVEAEAAAALLKNAGIPYLIQSQEGMLHGPLFPGATIHVVPELAEAAREVLGITDEEEEA